MAVYGNDKLVTVLSLPGSGGTKNDEYYEIPKGNVIGEEGNFYENPKGIRENENDDNHDTDLQNTYLAFTQPAETSPTPAPTYSRKVVVIGFMFFIVVFGLFISVSAWSVYKINLLSEKVEKLEIGETITPKSERRISTNECASHNCDLNATCKEIVGSFVCICNTGYYGSGHNCSDIDECVQSSDTCDKNATCVNTMGAFECNCSHGFHGDGYNCTACSPQALGMQSRSITDSAITASHEQPDYEARRGRLNNAGNWWPGFIGGGVWIQVDVGKLTDITGIQTQGDGGGEPSKDWVTKLKIQYGESVSALVPIVDGAGQPMVFNANTDTRSVVTISFPKPLRTRIIRVIPIEYAEDVFQMRLELLGCL